MKECMRRYDLMLIRDFKVNDINNMVEILKLNNQYEMPEVEGPEAMKRVKECSAAIFLVAEANENVVGFIKGVYDGSRALIHLLSIHPKYQKRGIGTNLVKKIIERFKKRGAPTASATVTEKSIEFWKKVGFRKTKAFVVGNW